MTANNLYSSDVIIVNGVKMSLAEYKKRAKEINAKNNPKPQRREKRVTEITILPEEIKMMMRGLRLMHSLVCFYNNSYKQYGVIARDILNTKEIHRPFVMYVKNVREAEDLINEIETISKRNKKDVFEFIRRLSWKLDDAKDNIVNISKGVSTSNVLQRYSDHVCINGDSRRLGLRTLIGRTYSTIKEMDAVIKNLQAIADKGVDIMCIAGHLSTRSKKICVNY